MAASYVQLPANGVGEKMQTVTNTVDGTADINASCVQLVSAAGASHDDPNGVGVAVAGAIAHDAADSGSPVKVGGKASTAIPTAVSNGDRVNAYYNEYGEAHVVSARIRTSVQLTPTVDTSIYAAGDAVGGLLTFTSVARKSGGTGRVTKVVITDASKQSAQLDLVLFNQTFSATADQSAFAPSTADLANCIGSINIPAANYSAFSANSAATVQLTDFPFVLASGTSLFGQLVSRGTPTYTNSSHLKVRIEIEMD